MNDGNDDSSIILKSKMKAILVLPMITVEIITFIIPDNKNNDNDGVIYISVFECSIISSSLILTLLILAAVLDFAL